MPTHCRLLLTAVTPSRDARALGADNELKYIEVQ